MKEPEFPEQEQARQATLDSLAVLDTPPEERFDRLTRVARRLLDTPIALVSLVDRNRQWFKSCIGLEVSETPRAISFCGHAILGDEVFIIPDALQDERFADNPLVTGGPLIRFYIGCPIKAPNGMKMGTLCLIDQKPRTVSQDEIDVLQDLAHMAEREMAVMQMAIADELTGIPNRRGFSILAENSLNFCKRKSLPAALVAMDLDKFKQINDRFGHAEGDRALTDFANCMTETLRSTDHCGRLGGDEFVALLLDTGKDRAVDVVKRLQDAVTRQVVAGAREYELSFSAGVIEYDSARHSSIQALLEEGDALMYEQKNAG